MSKTFAVGNKTMKTLKDDFPCSIVIICIMCCQVIATHNYEGQDEDELTFEKGQVILVVPYDDPDDQVMCAVKFSNCQ